MNDNKTFISEYLEALSGYPKTREVIEKYVDDKSLTQHILESESAFPCYQLIAEGMLAEADKVVVRGLFRGEHLGLFAGIPATGKTAEANLIIIYEVRNRKIVNHWMHFDAMGLIQQLQQAAAAEA